MMTASLSLRRGEIWVVDFGQGRGSEQGGRRPADLDEYLERLFPGEVSRAE
jgi:hypothetical protein